MPFKWKPDARKVQTPLAAFTMAALVFVYARTSIQAAKRNAEKHREADGGQINWHNESLRSHGRLERPEKQNTVSQLIGVARGKDGDGDVDVGKDVVHETEAERLIKERARKGRN
ncbi:Uncharacterized protein BP5553_05496 [Venustampulla echinocandica]|uniref:Uncharacterized protein n=1 Tax=Venustampulla echinocandica TaxID=2656787 RepID=A0A370TRC4_9HELO|nr:Uncharacterized protein BP5553_05496 [Venustampulla echinocandica]RDL38063.1 Uncharacterized protein BP5553_05496 [Venustampulla echinocandica]